MNDNFQFSNFVEWAFLGLISCGVYILWYMKKTLADLNTHVVVIIEKVSRHEKEIEEHDKRLREIELGPRINS